MKFAAIATVLLASPLFSSAFVSAQVPTLPLVAVGTLDGSRAGSFTDLSGLDYKLENGVAANYLGGFGSAITHVTGDTFLALPDRGPNADVYDAAIDNTASYINRFHTVKMELTPNKSGVGLPYKLTPELESTTLLWSLSPLAYGSGDGLGVGSGVPPINNFFRHYFTGRSDNFNPDRNSGDADDARFDTEGIRISNDGLSVFISDEYGPYIYQFDRRTGLRLRYFELPDYFYVSHLSPVGATEISGNMVGRTANKGMEGLAITPDGKTLVGIMQNALIQDALEGKPASNLLRIVTIDIRTGKVKHQYGYLLTAGSGVSEILALNEHEFLVDERDGHGRADGSNAVVKQLFKIDLAGATDIGGMDGTTAATHAVSKALFVDLVASFNAAGIPSSEIPAKIEGISFGPDLKEGKKTRHTLWVANDNDFVPVVADPNGAQIPNPNQFFVFTFTDADLDGSRFRPQEVKDRRFW